MVKRVTMKKKKLVKVSRPKSRLTRTKKSQEGSMNLLHTLGQTAGTFLGGPVGGQLGLAAGKLISKITGFGDYKVSKNSISMGNSVPTFQVGGGGVRICHREFLTDVVGSTGFVNTSYSINPGLLASFPWLSLVANTFEEYSLEGLVYEYRPSSGSAVSSTSSALGVVVLATDYDATNPPFATKQQMESYQFSTSTVPFTGCLHPVECARSQSVLNSQFIRTGPAPYGSDLRLFDMGNFQIATVGMQSAYTVGELWVSYDVIFRKPRLPSIPSGLSYAHLRTSPPATGNPTAPFGPNPLILDNYLQVLPDTVNKQGVILTLPGVYMVVFNTKLGGALTTYLGANLSAGPKWFSFSGSPYADVTAQASTLGTIYGSWSRTVQVNHAGTGPDNIVGFTGSSGSGDSELFVVKISDSPKLAAALIEQERVEKLSQSLEKFSLKTEERKSRRRESTGHDPIGCQCCANSNLKFIEEDCGCAFANTVKGWQRLAICADCNGDEDDSESFCSTEVRYFEVDSLKD